MSLAAVAFVARYGTNVPVWDDYNIISAVIGEKPLSLEWLWEQWNEHRIALPKLILVHAERIAGNDVRAGMLLSRRDAAWSWPPVSSSWRHGSPAEFVFQTPCFRSCS